jgi:hypothetical protein
MATQHPEHYIVLVSWSAKELPFLRELEKRLQLGDPYRTVLWDWSTDPGNHERPGWKERLFGPINFRARRLQSYLRAEPFRKDDELSDPEITLIARGKSCRVVKRYLVGLVGETQNNWRDRRRIRQAVFLSPRALRRARLMLWFAAGMGVVAIAAAVLAWLDRGASTGFDLLATVSGAGSALMFALFQTFVNEEALTHLGFRNFLDTDDVERVFDQLIVNGSKRRAGTWPIPSRTADSADELADCIRIPKGHKNVYEVMLQRVELKIAPIDPAEAPAEVRQRGWFENRADRAAKVVFSDGNNTSPTDLPHYDLSFRTHGYMQMEAEPAPNLWTEKERGEWLDNRRVFHYWFRPDRNASYALDVTVYGGFNQGDRSSHTHVDATCYVQKSQYELDLRPYLNAGWQISRFPELYYFPPRAPRVEGENRDFPDDRCDCLTSGRKLENGRRFEIASVEPGLFQWSIESIRDGGIIGYIFDVTAPVAKDHVQAPSSPPQAPDIAGKE